MREQVSIESNVKIDSTEAYEEDAISVGSSASHAQGLDFVCGPAVRERETWEASLSI
jgi:hypothetical protein